MDELEQKLEELQEVLRLLEDSEFQDIYEKSYECIDTEQAKEILAMVDMAEDIADLEGQIIDLENRLSSMTDKAKLALNEAIQDTKDLIDCRHRDTAIDAAFQTRYGA